MGAMEPEKDRLSHELGLVIEAVAPDPEQAASICACARSTLFFISAIPGGYPRRQSRASL